jgi:transposase
MKPLALTAEQRKEIDRRRKETHDRRIYQRLTAVLAVASGKTREDIADLLGVSLSQLGEWLRVFRNEGLEALCEIHNKGDPGNLSPDQIAQLKSQVSTGCFRNSDQIRHWVESSFGVRYSPTGIKDLLNPDYSKPSRRGCRPWASSPWVEALRPGSPLWAHRPLTPTRGRHGDGLSGRLAGGVGNGSREGGTQALANSQIPAEVRPTR